MGKKNDSRFWNIPVPSDLDDAVEVAVQNDTHVSKAELIRDVVRRFLIDRGVLK